MLKKINKILHDKNDYHLDPSLKNDVELSDYFLQKTLELQKSIIIRKIRYFYKYDKFIFARIALKYLLRTLIGVIIIGVLALLSIYVFNIDIDFRKIQKEPVRNIPVYIPATGDAEKDSLNILYYKENLNKDAEYILFYLKDPSRNFKTWAEALSKIESGGYENQYEARREGSQYWGKYQMGTDARKTVKMERYTWEEFKSNPELQEVALKLWVQSLKEDLKYSIKKYDGMFLNGWFITESGIIAMAHNVGVEPTSEFLSSGGKSIPVDGSGKPATRFLVLGNYNLDLE
jgi:hypothetical protein